MCVVLIVRPCYSIGRLNSYRVQVDPCLTPLVVKYQDKVITFVDRSASLSANINIPPPQPTTLALHASFAKVLHASGAKEFFDHILKDESEGTKLLAGDESTDLLLMMGYRGLSGT